MASWTDDLNWDDIIKLGLSLYLNKQGQKTPNFTPVPLSPEDADWNDKRKSLYEGGGSDAMKTVGGVGRQFLSQMPTTAPGFKFMSPQLAGQPFAGGVQIPRIDLSKLPGGGGGIGGGQPTTPPPTPAKPGETTGNRRPDTTPGGELGSPSRPSFGSDPNTLPNMTGANPNLNPTDIRSVASAWESFKSQHPNWAKLGVGAVVGALAATTGLAGAIVGKILQSILKVGGGQEKGKPTDPGARLDAQGTLQPTNPLFTSGIAGWGDNSSDNGFINGSIANSGGATGGSVISKGDAERFFPSGGVTGAIGQPPPYATPKPSLPWDTRTDVGKRQRKIADNFNSDLRGPDIFDEYVNGGGAGSGRDSGGGYNYGGRGLL